MDRLVRYAIHLKQWSEFTRPPLLNTVHSGKTTERVDLPAAYAECLLSAPIPAQENLAENSNQKRGRF